MAKVTTEFDIELAKWQAKIAQIKADMASTRQAAVKANLTDALVSGGQTGSSKGRAGMLAMQVQDIAVQAQMGTSWLTILAQQGSQIASIFGPGGAILGGFVALAGAAVMVGKRGNEAFTKLMDDAKALREEMEKLQTSGGSIDTLIAGFDRLAKQGEALKKAKEDLDGFGSVLSGTMGVFTGGKSQAEKEGDLIIEEGKTYWERQALAQRLLEISEQQVNVAEMRAKGLDEEADALERQIALERDLAKIRASSLGGNFKKELEEDRKAIEDANAERRAKDEADKAAKEQADKEERAKKDAEEEAKRQAEEEADRQANIQRMQEQLEDGRVEMLPDDQKLAEYQRRLQAANERAADAAAAGDEEGRLKALLEAQELEKRVVSMQNRPTGPDQQETVRTAKTPGAVAGALNILFGRSANELILDESQKQTQQIQQTNRLLERIETTLKNPKPPPDWGRINDEIFTP
jgi:hypothetical protein